ncbi:MAG: YkgJ family cysteine cluster protein [Hyphomicrobiaceae bacterium]|nr:YkgJ family cysteine cluster protein [Hyphomicrobiaceae bacterium]
MSDDSRQQRRRLVRERLKTGQRALAKGVPQTPTRPDIVGIAEVLRAKLEEAGNDRRASEAARIAQGLSERSLKAHPAKVPIACKKGCGYCCHTFVAVLPPEAFRLADAVRGGTSRALGVEAVRARTLPLRGLSPDQRVGAKLPCPLLVDGECSVYADRPLVCRQATSLSLPSCIEEYEGTDREGRIEISSAHLAHSSNAHVALLGAMQAAGLPTDAFELGAVLDLVLADPAAERRWLAGEDVFAPLPRNVVRERQVELVAERIAAELRA